MSSSKNKLISTRKVIKGFGYLISLYIFDANNLAHDNSGPQHKQVIINQAGRPLLWLESNNTNICTNHQI